MRMKKGVVLLRSVVFAILILGGVLALSSLAVLDISSEYGNTNMTTEFNADNTSTIGSRLLANASQDMDNMKKATQSPEGKSGLLKALLTIDAVLTGASTVLQVIFLSPVYIGSMISSVSISIGLPTAVSNLIGLVIITLLYAIIIFGILTALLRGGKV